MKKPVTTTKKVAKKRGTQDTTVVNLRASRKRERQVQARLAHIEEQIRILFRRTAGLLHDESGH